MTTPQEASSGASSPSPLPRPLLSAFLHLQQGFFAFPSCERVALGWFLNESGFGKSHGVMGILVPTKLDSWWLLRMPSPTDGAPEPGDDTLAGKVSLLWAWAWVWVDFLALLRHLTTSRGLGEDSVGLGWGGGRGDEGMLQEVLEEGCRRGGMEGRRGASRSLGGVPRSPSLLLTATPRQWSLRLQGRGPSTCRAQGGEAAALSENCWSWDFFG